MKAGLRISNNENEDFRETIITKFQEVRTNTLKTNEKRKDLSKKKQKNQKLLKKKNQMGILQLKNS